MPGKPLGPAGALQAGWAGAAAWARDRDTRRPAESCAAAFPAGRTQRALWEEAGGARSGHCGGVMGPGGGRGRAAAPDTFQLAAILLPQPPEARVAL